MVPSAYCDSQLLFPPKTSLEVASIVTLATTKRSKHTQRSIAISKIMTSISCSFAKLYRPYRTQNKNETQQNENSSRAFPLWARQKANPSEGNSTPR